MGLLESVIGALANQRGGSGGGLGGGLGGGGAGGGLGGLGDVLGSVLGGARPQQGGQGGGQGGGLGGMLGGAGGAVLMQIIASLLANRGGGGMASRVDAGGAPGGGGLGELIEHFQRGGLGDVIGSWVGSGQNMPVSPGQLGQVFDRNELEELARQTGMSTDDLLGQLAQHLPEAINQVTPQGQVPSGGLGDISDVLRRFG